MTDATSPTEETAQQDGVLSSVMIRLVDPLNKPEFYCVDGPGHGTEVQLDSPLTAHTSKPFGSADELWVLNYPAAGQIYIPAYERCIEAEHAKAGASLYLRQSSDFQLAQNWRIYDQPLSVCEMVGLGNSCVG